VVRLPPRGGSAVRRWRRVRVIKSLHILLSVVENSFFAVILEGNALPDRIS